ncbi:MAG: alpha/beta hydrolase [Bacteroidota bacterium]
MKYSTLPWVLLIGMSCYLACSNSQEPSSNEPPKTSTTTKDIRIENEGVLINYKSDGQGPYTVLFVHGWCIDQSYWADQMETLRSDYRVVTLDLPGFGTSGKNRSDWTMEAYGADIKALINQLQLDKVILVGHSMGGNVILEAALDNDKVIALIGVDNFKDVGMDYGENVEAEMAEFLRLLEENFAEVAPAYAEGNLFHPSTDSLAKARVIEDFRTADPQTAFASLKGLFDYAAVEPQRLSQVQQPLYLINSSATPSYKEGLDATGVQYEIIDIDSTGHYPMIEKPMVFNDLLKKTLQKITATE